MSIDFLWQNLVWLVIGLVAVQVRHWIQTRLRHQRLRRFFGASALGTEGIVVTIPVLRPLSRDNFDPNADKTVALKTDDTGKEVCFPIYEEVLNFRDFQSADEIFKLLRNQGAKTTSFPLLPDSESLGNYQGKNPCLVCLGSPFVNATLGELLRLAEIRGERLIYGNRASSTLDTYRLDVHYPEHLTLGVDETHAVGVIARFPNPVKPKDSIVGVWGCRAESTLEAARYFRSNFKKVVNLSEADIPLVILLAIHGLKLNLVEEMYAATNRVIFHNDKLLRYYLHDEAPGAAPESTSRAGS